MKKFWIILAVLSVVGIIVIWLYSKNNNKKEVVYQESISTGQVGAKDYIDSINTGLNSLSGLFSTLKRNKQPSTTVATGGAGGVTFTPTPGVKYPALTDIKR